MRFYTGKCEKCKGVIAGMVDLPDTKKDTAINLKEWIQEGYIVESYDGDMGPKLTGCQCKKMNDFKKDDLFAIKGDES